MYKPIKPFWGDERGRRGEKERMKKEWVNI
jgi:hypothetical protein